MFPRVYIDVDPATLRFNRLDGIGLWKLQTQIAKFGSSMKGMPPILLYQGTDGELLIYHGVHRAARIAKLLPGTLIHAEIMDCTKMAYGHFPTIGASLP